MADLLAKIRKAIEDSLENAKANAQGLKEIAEDYGKTARLKFELRQLKISERKKFELLGRTVYPYLLANDFKGLQKHETLPVIIDDLKNLQNEIQLTQNELNQHLNSTERSTEVRPQEKVQEEIKEIESEIEKRLEEIRRIREEAKQKQTPKKRGRRKTRKKEEKNN